MTSRWQGSWCYVSVNGQRPTLEVPNLAAAHRLATQLHAAGETWVGDVAGWPASYSPRRVGVLDGDGVEAWRPARFECGVPGTWSCAIEWATRGPPTVWVEKGVGASTPRPIPREELVGYASKAKEARAAGYGRRSTAAPLEGGDQLVGASNGSILEGGVPPPPCLSPTCPAG